MSRSALVRACALLGIVTMQPASRGEPMPFQHKVEVYRQKEGDVVVFVLRLEQPFLAEEFEKSNYLRLTPTDRNAYLIYPKETRFHQKHAEFYGRLRGSGKAKIRLSYETVSETLRGSRKVEVRHADLEIDIPAEPGGPRETYPAWASRQNDHFLRLLNDYPEESFFQYALLQSRDRYGVTPPAFEKPRPAREELETSLYDLMSGSLAVQDALQLHVLETSGKHGDLDVHVSQLTPPRLRSLDYGKLLEAKAAKKIEPRPHDLARFVPADQYFLHFNSMQPANDLQDLLTARGDSLLRLFTVRARDNRLREKLEEQLCLSRDPLSRLFADSAVTELAVTGSDPFLVEGTDVTVLLRVKRPDVFDRVAAQWLEQAKDAHPGLVEREFHYRGHKVAARYTEDRRVSSFVVRSDDVVIYSNSHRAVRQVIDVATGKAPRLADAPDYLHATTLLPPLAEKNAGYCFASEAFIRRLIGPQSKIAERRRMLCFNNLVMLNNAALFHRLEHRKAPASLTDLVEGRFVDPAKVVCPHGGAYAWDDRAGTCTCSLHNRLRYLTPNTELTVLKVSREEQEEYARYRARYEQYWQTAADPIAARIIMGERVKVELCVVPVAPENLYAALRRWVSDTPGQTDARRFARSAVATVVATRGRKAVGEFIQGLPGISEALQADPTLTDLTWLGDSIAFHFCDGDKILELDPTRLRELDAPFGGKLAVSDLALGGAVLTATEIPSYFTVDVEDGEKAARLLELLTRELPVQKRTVLTLPATLDAYRLPPYKKHTRYVLSIRVHALKLRLHVALVGRQLVAATKADLLREVIDAAEEPATPPGGEAPAHLLLRLNLRAPERLKDNLRLSWSEKARVACHRNTISIYNLLKLYEVPIEEVPRLAEAQYGVRYFCPEHGTYEYDAARDQVLCSVHGNRQDSRQRDPGEAGSSFDRFFDGLDEVLARVRFEDDAVFATLEIARRPVPEK